MVTDETDFVSDLGPVFIVGVTSLPPLIDYIVISRYDYTVDDTNAFLSKSLTWTTAVEVSSAYARICGRICRCTT